MTVQKKWYRLDKTERRRRIGNFACAISVFLLLPLVALVPSARSGWSEEDLGLIAALYALSLSVSSMQVGFFGILLFIGVLNTVSYKLYAGSSVSAAHSLAFWTIVGTCAMMVVERYIRHIREGESPFLFQSRERRINKEV